MSSSPILPGPRHGWLGRLLEGGSAIPGLGKRCGRAQRVRRKRLRAELSSASGPTETILNCPEGQGCHQAIRAWLERPATAVDLPPMDGGPRDPAVRCSVIINTVDRAKDLKITLEDLREQWLGDRDELIVVLGPTLDDSREVVATAQIPCRVIECGERNLARSRNLGLAAARGEYVVFLDDDASPGDGWLDSLLETLRQDAGCGVAAGFAMDGAGKKFLTRYVVSDSLGDSMWFDTSEEAESSISQVAGRFLSATGCSMAFRRDRILELGGFDPYYAYFLEETDLVLRLRQRGFHCVACPASVVRHRQGQNPIRSAEASLVARMRLVKSQLHFIGKFANADDRSRAGQSIWRRILSDLERIAWEHPAQAAELQREYLKMVCEEVGSHGHRGE